MMGRGNQEQGQLFYSFDLDAAVPDDHLVREIAAVLDLTWVHSELAPHYSHTGRPSIDPALMIRMLIVGYVFAIRSERALCREVQVNLAYRWFCGLSIEDKLPDHSAFSRARNERFRDSDIFRRVFERVVAACIAADLVGGKGFAVDASLIAADANKHRSIPGEEWNKEIDPSRQAARSKSRRYCPSCQRLLQHNRPEAVQRERQASELAAMNSSPTQPNSESHRARAKLLHKGELGPLARRDAFAADCVLRHCLSCWRRLTCRT